MQVRVATAQDAAAIARVHVASFRATYADRFDPADLAALDPAHRTVTWTDRLGQDDGAVLVATTDTEVRGFAWATPTPDADDDPRRVGQLRSIHVDPAAQGTGVGRRLLATVREHLRGWGARDATLWVADDNAQAARVYARDGWRPDGARRHETLALPGERGPSVTVVRLRRALTDTTTDGG